MVVVIVVVSFVIVVVKEDTVVKVSVISGAFSGDESVLSLILGEVNVDVFSLLIGS